MGRLFLVVSTTYLCKIFELHVDMVMTNSPILQNDYDLRHLSEDDVKSVLYVVAAVCESLDEAGYQVQLNISCLSDEEEVN